MRVLVTASRDWDDWGLMVDTLAAYHAEGNTLVVGRGGRGDRWAESIAVRLGWTIDPHPADWDRRGRAAGPIRNSEMVQSGAHVCLAFIRPCRQSKCDRPKPHGSHGASDTADLAEQADIPTVRVRKQ